MNQALNLLADTVEKGIKRSSEKAIGIAAPVTIKTILQNSRISSSFSSQGFQLHTPVCFVVALHLLKHTLSIV